MNHQLSRTRPFVLLMGLLAALVLLFVCLYTLSVQAAPEARPDRQPVQLNQGSVASHGRADSLFIENRGQFDPAVRFAFRHGWGQTWLTEDAIWITLVPGPTSQPDEIADGRRTRPVEQELQAGALKLTFAGARTNPVIEPGGVQPGHFSYLKGPDPAAWVSQVPLWEQVRYRDLYPGIDLVFSAPDAAEDRVLPWRLEARPGADLNAVRLQIAGPDRLEVDGGKMRLQTGIGEVRLPLLVVHGTDSQVAATISQETAVSVERLGRDEFLLTTPFTTRSSGAGPAAVTAGGLFYSTYLGGSSWDWAYDLAVDGAGAVYVVGVTPSADFPTTTGSFSTTLSRQDAFVVKLNPEGSGLEYGTFLGGSGAETAYGLTVDAGQVFVTGNTWSADFPTTAGAYDTSCGVDGQCDGWDDAFLAQLSADGSQLLYSTFVGGGDEDKSYAIDVSAGSVYLAGATRSDDFPTTWRAFDRSCGSDDRCNPYQGEPVTDAFLVRIDPAGGGESDLLYATYLGGSEDDSANALVVSGGDAFLTGHSSSFDFPASGYVGDNDAFVARLEPAGGGKDDLIYGTFMGGSNADRGNGIAVNGSVASVVGETRSADFPVITGTFGGGFNDAFVARIGIDGSVIYAAYFGGSDRDDARDIVIDDSGAMVVAGYTQSLSDTFPVTDGAYDQTYNGGRDVFVARILLESDAPQHVTYASYFGGSGDEVAYAVDVNELGQGFLAGYTNSATDFPITDGSFDLSYNGGSLDTFVSKLQVGVPPGLRLEKFVNGFDADEPPGPYYYVGQPVTWTYVVTNTSQFTLTGVTIRDDQLGHVCGPVTLRPGDDPLRCEMHGTTEAGQYVNAATATGQPPQGFDPVVDVDLSHYFGAAPAISLTKRTNGANADLAPGPYIRQGDAVTWSYQLTNTGNVPLSSISVADSIEGPVGCDASSLAPNATMTCLIAGTAASGQYANEGSVSAMPPAPLQAISAENDSHYFGFFGSLALKKLTNGQEVNRPPGPHILVGDEVSWTYVVTNASNITLTEITVVDDQVGTIGCPPFALGPGGAMQCLAGGAAIVGQYHNEATVSGRPPGGPIFAAGAESYYFGAEPSLKLDKRSSGVFIDGAGPFVLVNDPVTWTYMLTNTGNVTLTDIIILDDNGPDDGFLVCEVGTLPPGSQAETCTASGLAVAGPYRNVGAAYGTPPDGLPQIVAEDASSYYGAAPAVALQKLTNGHMAVTPPGPGIVIGQSVTWRYVITNTGNITLTALTVSDDNGSPADNSDDITVCERTDLGPGDTTYCQLVGTAYLGQYANVGRVVASPLLGDDVMASALSHYVGLRGVFLPLIVR